MHDGTSRLSRKERAVLQNDGDIGNTRDFETNTWQWRISKKVQATISDVRLMLEYRNETVDITAPLLDCSQDLIAIRDRINELLEC